MVELPIFRAREGETFYLHPEGAKPLPLILQEVKETAAGGDRAGLARQEPFSLLFRGPHRPPLPQGLYDLTHDTLADLDPIFLVPVAEDAAGRYYEAVFN